MTLVRGPNEALIGTPGSRELLETPALILDIDAMDANIAAMAEHAAGRGYGLRPVVKIHKSVDIARRQVAAGALGVCCATLEEAETMVDAGIPGVLLFTPVVSAHKLDRLAALHARATGLLVAADDASIVTEMGTRCRGADHPLDVLVDVEVGGNRTGVGEGDAVALALHIAETDGVSFAGVQAYVGRHQHIGDYPTRRAQSVEYLAPVKRVLDALASVDLTPRVISGGGTGTHDFDSDLGPLTEIQAGSYVFMDVNYDGVVLRQDGPVPFQHALFVRTSVISVARQSVAITDAGIKELDMIFGLEHPRIVSGVSPDATYSLVGDDMGRIDLRPSDGTPALGTAIEVVPPHCYQTLFMYPYYHVVKNDSLVDIWPIVARTNW
jgi:3-hydroxy-D-aspartate aldolase